MGGGREAPGSRRRRRRGGKCSRGPSPVQLLLPARSSTALCTDVRGASSACAECVAARNECSGGGQPVPGACGCAPAHLRLLVGGQNPRNATWSLSGNFVRMIFPLLIILIMPILRSVGIPVLPFHESVLKSFQGRLQKSKS